MSDYRVCFNQAPHEYDWWTVEKLVPFFVFWKRWKAVKYAPLPASFFLTTRFGSKQKALSWIEQDRKPRQHICEAA